MSRIRLSLYLTKGFYKRSLRHCTCCVGGHLKYMSYKSAWPTALHLQHLSKLTILRIDCELLQTLLNDDHDAMHHIIREDYFDEYI